MAPRTRRSTGVEIRLQNEHMDREDRDYEEEIADFSDDSESSLDSLDEDPSFDVHGEEACMRLSNLSIKTSRNVNCKDDGSMSDEEEPYLSETAVPPLDVNEEKCFEEVEKIINDGGIEKLKVDQCKIYLRKYGLRLTGRKNVLIGRIKEHLEVKDGGGHKLYPKSSFVLNCKGDACTGDVVMFEQNVYDMYNIVSRSATPCGIRLVAGRIVKESYGAAKQQHTFTIEVLWSEGVKPLPALHPLLIKGRNLYKLKTMRQRWPDEMERSKVLREKHLRGSRARSSREARVQLKEMRKKLATSKRTNEQGGITTTSNQQKNILPPLFSEIVPAAPTFTENGPFQGNAPYTSHNMNCQGQIQPPLCVQAAHYALPSVNSQIPQHSLNLSILPEPSRAGMHHVDANFMPRASNVQLTENIPTLCINQHFPSHHHRNLYGNRQPRQPLTNLNSGSRPCNQQQTNKRQVCRHFSARGSCHFGDSCKFLHDRR